MGAWMIDVHPDRTNITFGDGSVCTLGEKELGDLLPQFVRHTSRMRFPQRNNGCVVTNGFDAAAVDIATVMTQAGQKQYAKVPWAVRAAHVNPYLHGALCMLVSEGCAAALGQIAPALWSGRMTVSRAFAALTEARKARTA